MGAKKIASLLTIGSFLLSCGVSERLLAATDPAPPPQLSAPDRNPVLLTQQYGRITDARLSGSGQIVITIQDLHCHPEVQRNIARILALLDTQYGLKNVYVEGGYGTVDTSWLCDIKDPGLKNEIVENLVNRGRLTGSEYYSVLSGRPTLLKGVEDEAVHKTNLARLGRIIERKPAVERQLVLLDRELSAMKARNLGAPARRFDRLTTQYENGRITSDAYYRQLIKQAELINTQARGAPGPPPINLADYPNVTLYRELAGLKRQVNARKASRQLQSFVRILKENLPYGAYQSFLEQTGRLSDWEKLARYCQELDSAYHLGLNRFPDLRHYFAFTVKSGKLNPVHLLQEQRQLARRIRGLLSQSAPEADVAFLADFFTVFQNFLRYRISSDEYAYFTAHFGAFRATWTSYAFTDGLDALTDDCDLLSAFHETNTKRNDCFVKRLPLPENSAPGATVIVTGGFHTEGLAALLRKRGIPYCSITPNLTQDTRLSATVYTSLAREQAALLAHAMQLGLASQAVSREKFALCISAAHKELRDLRFTRENFETLMSRLAFILGNEQIRSTRFNADEGTASVTFSNNRTITFRRADFIGSFEPEDTFVALETVAGEAAAAAVRQIAAVVRNGVVTSEALVGLVPLIPAASAAYVKIMRFAAEHDMVYGNGYTTALRTDEQLRNHVNTTLGTIAALLPDAAQDTAADTAARKIRLAENSRGSLLQAAIAVDIVHDLIIALNPAPRRPLPALLDTVIDWADFTREDIVTVPACPVSADTDGAPVGTVRINGKELTLAQCPHCGMIWYRTRPPESFYQALYDNPVYFGNDMSSHGLTSTVNVGIMTNRPDIAQIAARELELWKRFITTLQGRSVLEVGPGGGHLLVAAREQGARVFAVDVSRFVVGQLKTNHAIAVFQGHLEDADVPAESQDIVAAYDLIEHVFDLHAFLHEVFKIMKPGGCLFIRTPDTNGNVPRLHLVDHIWHFSNKALVVMLKLHGFRILDSRPSGTFTGPDGQIIENRTIVAQKPAADDPGTLFGPPATGPAPFDGRDPALGTPEHTQDPAAFIALLSAA